MTMLATRLLREPVEGAVVTLVVRPLDENGRVLLAHRDPGRQVAAQLAAGPFTLTWPGSMVTVTPAGTAYRANARRVTSDHLTRHVHRTAHQT